MFKCKYHISNDDKFGSWVVLQSSLAHSRSLVRCICGEERLVRNADLFTRRSRSCGKKVCSGEFTELTGNRFGFWTVLQKDKDERASNGSIMWKCECICGVEKLVASKNLLDGSSKSCGCKRLETKFNTRPTLSPKERVMNQLYDVYRRGATKRGLIFELTREQFADLSLGNCHYCGVAPKQKIVIKRYFDDICYFKNGIDRKDSTRGYQIDNCVSCCWFCNRSKLDMSYDTFIDYLNQIFQFRSKAA